MSVSISEKLRGHVKARVESGDYHNESEYIRDLIRRDNDRFIQEQELLSTLRQAVQNGESNDTIPDIINAIKNKLKQ
ncbi:MAG: type II toxin-antitoxin system ParD family antitoxin [Alphaproteobacteria bacterium]